MVGGKNTSYPFVSLILPIRNEGGGIARCLDAVLAQDYPRGRLEILVVDGMSTDGTRSIVENFGLQLTNLKLLDNPDLIVPTALNLALRQVRGEIIIRVDGHCIIAPDYVRKCVEHLQRDGVDGVGGPIESIGETEMAKAIAIAMSSSFGVGNSAFRTISGKSMLADTVPFPAYTRKIVESAGFYDEELVRNQDDEYNYRIRELGGKILLADDVRSAYFTRSSLKGLWRQYFQYGFWKVRVLQKHPRQMSARQFAPPAFVASLFASAILLFAPLPSFSIHASFIIPMLYFATNLLASLYTAAQRGWKYLPLLPIIFAILHLSYGLGFLAGLVKFRNRWGDKMGKTPVWSAEPIDHDLPLTR